MEVICGTVKYWDGGIEWGIEIVDCGHWDTDTLWNQDVICLPQAAPLTLNCTAHSFTALGFISVLCKVLLWAHNALDCKYEVRYCTGSTVCCFELHTELNCTAQRHVVMRPRHKQYSCWGVKCPNTPSLHKYKNMEDFFMQVAAGGYLEYILLSASHS